MSVAIGGGIAKRRVPTREPAPAKSAQEEMKPVQEETKPENTARKREPKSRKG